MFYTIFLDVHAVLYAEYASLRLKTDANSNANKILGPRTHRIWESVKWVVKNAQSEISANEFANNFYLKHCVSKALMLPGLYLGNDIAILN